LYVYICMPHSRSKQETKSTSHGSMINAHWSKFTRSLFQENSSTTFRSSFGFGLLLSAVIFATIASSITGALTLFMMNSPLCWDLNLIGIYTGVSYAVSGLGLLVVTPLERRCMSDNIMAILSSLFCAAEWIYVFFVSSTAMMFLAPVAGLLSVQLFPCIRSMISEIADKKIGTLIGVTGAFDILCNMVGSIIMNSVYSVTLHMYTGFVFLVTATLYLIACILLTVHLIMVKKSSLNTSL